MNDAEGSIVLQAMEILVRTIEAGKRDSVEGEFVIHGKRYNLLLELERHDDDE
jgi:hypothetical protein